MDLEKIKLTDPFVLIGLLVIVAGVLIDFFGMSPLGAIFGIPLLSLVAIIIGLVLIYYSTMKK